LSSFALDLLSLERRLPPTSAHVPYTTLFRSESEPRRRRHELWRIRSGRAASFHCRGIRGAARGRRAGHGVRRDLEHAAGGRDGRAARARLATRPRGRMFHHRRFGHQPPPPPQYRRKAVPQARDTGRDRRLHRSLPALEHRRGHGEAVRSALPRRDRPLPAVARADVSAQAQGSEAGRTARTGRRIPRRGRRRGLGAGGDLQPAHPGRRSAQGRRHGRLGRVLSDADDLRRVHLPPRRGRPRRSDARAADRRVAGGSARGLGRQALPGQADADPGRNRADDYERLRRVERLGLTLQIARLVATITPATARSTARQAQYRLRISRRHRAISLLAPYPRTPAPTPTIPYIWLMRYHSASDSRVAAVRTP